MQTKIIEVLGHKFDVVMPSPGQAFAYQAELIGHGLSLWQNKPNGYAHWELLKKMLVGAEVDGVPLNCEEFFIGKHEVADLVLFSYVKAMLPNLMGKMNGLFQLKMAENLGSAES